MLVTNTSVELERFWHPVALVDEVTSQPRQVWLLGVPWALVRLSDGSLLAARDHCPHRLAPLSAGRLVVNELQCAYHGWQFDVGGRCTIIPALGPNGVIPSRARLAVAADVREEAGLVWMAPLAPLRDLESWPHTRDSSMNTAWLTPTTARVGAAPMIDNFLDIAHFPFLHAGTFGSDESSIVEAMDVREDEWTASCVIEHEFANREDAGVARGERPLLQRRRMSFSYSAPFTACLRLDHLDTGLVTTLLFAVQPETNDRCRLFTVLSRGGSPELRPDDKTLAESCDYEQTVLEEDLWLQTQLPLEMNVGPNTDLHTRADKLALGVRRILARCMTSR